MSAMLKIAALRLDIKNGRSRTHILRGVDLSIEPGEIHGLVGESGAGKSMIGQVILGLAPKQATIVDGRVMFDGTDITSIPERERRALMGKGLALIPQDPVTALNPAFRIGKQITDTLELHLGLKAKQADDYALKLLRDVHIRNAQQVFRQYPHELSGGMCQRVLIAIAFACKPKLIVADEPTSALDLIAQRQVLRLIKELQENEGTSLLFITHDLGVVAKICDRVTVLHAGRVIEHGTAEQIIESPTHAYTQALLRATPRYDRPANAMKPVPAELTQQLNLEAVELDRGERYARGT